MDKSTRYRKGRIGLVINTAIKPSRDVHLGVVNCLHSSLEARPLLFVAGSGTSPENIKKFAENDLDGMIFCGLRRDIAVEFGKIMPNHPPVVLCTYAPLTAEELSILGYGGEVVLDNAAIGVQAADFFIEHGHTNFAFLAANVYRERIAGEIRCEAFRKRVMERLGIHATFAKYTVGVVAENEDYWEECTGASDEWIKSLPRPCGVLVNGDREAANFLDICKRVSIKVPNELEILSINNSRGFCEQARPTITSLFPDNARCAREAVNMLMALIANPNLPQEKRKVMVSSCRLVERGTTSGERGFGHVVARAREFITANACKGISVSDVVKEVGISRRLLEKRVREATGHSVLDMIQKVRLDNVCHLLKTTVMPIAEVTVRSGYELTSNLSRLFHRTFGMSMREYRNKEGGNPCGQD
jgi:LacI family transcriptional regulator